MQPKTPAGRPESGPSDPFDFDRDDSSSDDNAAGPGKSEGIRLNKFLAQNGVASRRGADELIASGHVTVDGELVTELGRRVDPAREKVEVDGVALRPAGERLAYYLLNKPRGVVCTNDPREARPRALDLITDKRKGRIYTIGRLDEDTEGLVILTNDGEFANRISHPRYGVKKTYWVDVRGRVADESLERMQKGVRLSDGWGSFERVKVLKRHAERSILLVTLAEGKNREVRRVLAALDLPVRNLRRIQIGSLADRRLKLGQWRTLTRSEVGELLDETKPGASGVVRPFQRTGKGSHSSRRPWSKHPPRRREDERRPFQRGPARGGRAGRRER
jgi:23S rRNA pseudouridine2605 synthase